MTPMGRFDAAGRASSAPGVEVDLADLRAGSTVLAARVVALGRLVRTRDDEARVAALRCRCETMSDDVHLRRARAEVEARLELRFR